MTEKIKEVLINRKDIINLIYKTMQVVFSTLIIGGLYGGWAKGSELLDAPERIKTLEKRMDKQDTLYMNMDEKLDIIIQRQENQRLIDSLKAEIKKQK